MTVQELIDELKKVKDKSLKVVVEADHGQTPMTATWSGEIQVADENEYLMESVHEDDVDEYDDLVTVYCLQAY